MTLLKTSQTVEHCDIDNRPVSSVIPLNWTDELPPDKSCMYDHCTADTPFGRFLITWKSWKDYPAPAVDETPWGDFYAPLANTVAQAKVACEKEFARRVKMCLVDGPQT